MQEWGFDQAYASEGCHTVISKHRLVPIQSPPKTARSGNQFPSHEKCAVQTRRVFPASQLGLQRWGPQLQCSDGHLPVERQVQGPGRTACSA
eukprot:1159546-Pelagomonas_calceolata.AAC.5